MKYWSLVISLLSLAILPSQVLAVSPTALGQAIKEEVQERIENIASPAADQVEGIRNAVKEKVQENLAEMKLGLKRAVVGEISEISNSTITVSTLFGKQQVKVTDETKFVGQNRKDIKLTDLEIGNSIIALGYLNGDKILEAKRIIVFTKPKITARKVAFGKITDISLDEKLLTIKNERKGDIFSVEVNDKTVITKKVDGSVKVVKLADLKINDWVVTIGTVSEDEDKIIFAKLIHVIPGLSKPSPTASPKVTPTKSLTPSATPTVAQEE